MVEQQLAMLYTGVRFSSPAPVYFMLDCPKNICYYCMAIGGLAQLGDHLPYKQRVSGSSPLASTIIILCRLSSIGRATDL